MTLSGRCFIEERFLHQRKGYYTGYHTQAALHALESRAQYLSAHQSRNPSRPDSYLPGFHWEQTVSW